MDNERRRSVKKATPMVEGQGAALERQELSGPLMMWRESSKPHRMRQEPPGLHVVQ
jgi:hypothetical protein